MNISNIQRIMKKGRILRNEPMSKHTSFRVGGPAAYYFIPADEREAAGLIRYLYQNGLPYYVIGNGTDLLVSDSGYDGAIIDLGRHDGTSFTMLGIDEEHKDGILLDCGAGCLLSAVGNIALKLGATGFEPLYGIPGCVGGACIMNAGAFGAEIGDLITSVKVISREGELKRLERSELEFGYRYSSLSRDGYIVARAELILKRGEASEIKQRMDEISARRREKQPLEYPSAGSTFKRPKGDFAGRLIEDAGLRGLRIGGAMVSEKHCGFIINYDHATASDIYALIETVRKRVQAKSGVLLEPEVKLLGNF